MLNDYHIQISWYLQGALKKAVLLLYVQKHGIAMVFGTFIVSIKLYSVDLKLT